jgi:hypothetical protein
MVHEGEAMMQGRMLSQVFIVQALVLLAGCEFTAVTEKPKGNGSGYGEVDTISPQNSRLEFSSPTVTIGQNLTVTVHLNDAEGVGVAGIAVKVIETEPDGSTNLVSFPDTDSDGASTYVFEITEAGSYHFALEEPVVSTLQNPVTLPPAPPDPVTAKAYFVANVYPILRANCASCHVTGTQSPYLGDPDSTTAYLSAKTVLTSPVASSVLDIYTGNGHCGQGCQAPADPNLLPLLEAWASKEGL